ncbi:type VII toxin-antitoxin system HepT family RNase toxin [Lysinibacillus endophyticus]|uniref:type VII toxin-antitoxin system HepT family RNase toxin n=1 Tax=Ureibacillus endophyticus TaxID=1978490 RepID=UPI0031352CE7
MNNDVILNKIATIERCIKRVKDVYENNAANLKDFTKQDSIILNIQRACEACIDLAMHIVSEKKLGLPKTSRDAFKLLLDANIIESRLALSLMNMVGFRNIAVHDYQSIELDILQAIIEKHLVDFTEYTRTILSLK